MSLWKTLTLLGVIAAAWLFAPDFFEMVALMGGLVWLTEFFRIRSQSGPGTASVELPGELLGIKVRPGLSTVKFRWRGRPVHLAGTIATTALREFNVYDVAMPAFRKTPFCFVMRHVKALVREAELVENSRIPGIRFEYALERVAANTPLEAAANMPDLFAELLSTWEGAPPELWAQRGVALQKLFFNGRVLHAHLVLGEKTLPEDLVSFLEQQVAFHLTLLALLDKVDFKVPS